MSAGAQAAGVAGESVPGAPGVPEATVTPVVTVDRLSFAYPGGAQALCEVSFTVQPGERLAVLGANGAGKSTLLLHLSGILPSTPATSGSRSAVASDGPSTGATGTVASVPPRLGPAVTVAGLPLIARNLQAIRRLVGLVFQNPDDQLFCPTVFDDVAFGPRNQGLPSGEVAERVRESLTQVGLGDWCPAAGAPPAASESGRRSPLRLSFGQKKRVALAAVLALRPAVIACDEPTANLDPRGRAEILRLLGEIASTQIIVTHDLELVGALCDRAVLMARGRVVLQGAAKEVLCDRAGLRAAELI